MKDTTSTKENFDEFLDENVKKFIDKDNQPSKINYEQMNDTLNELFENFGTNKGEKTAKKNKSSAERANVAEAKKTNPSNKPKKNRGKANKKEKIYFGKLLSIFFGKIFEMALLSLTFIVIVVIAIAILFVVVTVLFGAVAGTWCLIISVIIALLVWIIGGIYLLISDTKGYYKYKKRETTCPNCKEPFAWSVNSSSGKELSKDYKTKEVKVGYGKNEHTRRGVFAYGTREVHYYGTCAKCGYKSSWQGTRNYEREV